MYIFDFIFLSSSNVVFNAQLVRVLYLFQLALLSDRVVYIERTNLFDLVLSTTTASIL